MQYAFGEGVIKGALNVVAKGVKVTEGMVEGTKISKSVEVLENVYQGGQKLIGPAGDAAARFVNKIPKDWVMKPAKKGIGTRYVNPKKSGDYIRFSAENLDPRAPLGQKVPYFERWKDGKCLTKEGKWVRPNPLNQEEYHIPQTMFEELSHLLGF